MYRKRVLYIDNETRAVPYSDIYDRAGKIWIEQDTVLLFCSRSDYRKACCSSSEIALAHLTAAEFRELIEELVALEGLGKLQEKLARSRALVSRRRVGSTEALSRQLYQLTLGLDRDGLPSQVMVALWEDLLSRKLDEKSGKRLEELAEKINVCLGAAHEVDPAREPELRTALDEYRGALTEKTGERVARLTMIMRAFAAVAHLVRETPANV